MDVLGSPRSGENLAFPRRFQALSGKNTTQTHAHPSNRGSWILDVLDLQPTPSTRGTWTMDSENQRSQVAGGRGFKVTFVSGLHCCTLIFPGSPLPVVAIEAIKATRLPAYTKVTLNPLPLLHVTPPMDHGRFEAPPHPVHEGGMDFGGFRIAAQRRKFSVS